MAEIELHQVSPRQRLQQLLNGYRMTQLAAVAAKLGLAERLAGGPQTPAALASATGAQIDALRRVLLGLVAIGLLVETEPGTFASTPLLELLQRDHPTSMWATTMVAGEESYRSWAELYECVMTGEPAFERVYGAGRFDYNRAHPKMEAIFNQNMSEISRQVAQDVASAYDFSAARVLVDVGGGQGMLLAAVLRANPTLRGVLFDQPQVVETADAVLRAAGVADRCEQVGGDFFASIPAGGDIYVMRSVLHDWDDARCVAILRRCKDALGPGAKLLVVESLMEADAPPLPIVLRDLQMLCITGGRERSLQDHEKLFGQAGLETNRVISAGNDASIIEAVPAA